MKTAKNVTLTGKNALKWLEWCIYRVWGMPHWMTLVLRLYIHGCICIILVTAHYKTTLVTFYNITKKTTPEENTQNVPYFSIDCTFFLWECLGHFWGDKDKLSSGRAKGRGKRRVWGERPKMRFIFAKLPLLNEIQTLSHKLLVRQTSNHHHCDHHAPKTYMQWLSSDFEQFFLVKNIFIYVFVRNKYGFQIGNAMEEINSVLTRKKSSKWLDTPCISIFGHANSNGTGFEAVDSGLYVCIILVTAQIFKPFGTPFPCKYWHFLFFCQGELRKQPKSSHFLDCDWEKCIKMAWVAHI